MPVELEMSVDRRTIRQADRIFRDLEADLGPRNAATVYKGALATPARRLRPKIKAATPVGKGPRDIRIKGVTYRQEHLRDSIRVNTRAFRDGYFRTLIGYRIRRTRSRPGQRVGKVLGAEYGNKRTRARRILRGVWNRNKSTVERTLRYDLIDIIEARAVSTRRRLQRGQARFR